MNEENIGARVALVTGASRGIGAATAIALAADGYHVVLTARTAGGLEEVEEAIFAAGGSATIAPMDLLETDSIPRLAAAVAERWGKLDLLVLNAAALGTLAAISAYDPKEVAKVLALNISAQAALIGAFDPLLRKSDTGRVIGLTSGVARRPRAFWGLYGATKAAFENLLLSYAEEVRNLTRVRVAIVDPGATRTKMRARAYPGEAPESVKPPEAVAERILGLLASDFETGAFDKIG
ncbi:SDR family NAD(P)-dependent oxidoreductase [Sphingomonas turrisvirgatae]|uniref:Oxidoreductase n=1 Tax=Sphingomonas turrisvirgatae TaxID=1888892 RepID=A0A1E3M2R2_9SPHN|nr:SDR family NAD(P)-dependent oxidoreductase [Sphingomonas turrisvirgatae]ODP39350.1 oxidoreductase [Sphingomonas turrisvirgatae]